MGLRLPSLGSTLHHRQGTAIAPQLISTEILVVIDVCGERKGQKLTTEKYARDICTPAYCTSAIMPNRHNAGELRPLGAVDSRLNKVENDAACARMWMTLG
jgi:hypothetical protein